MRGPGLVLGAGRRRLASCRQSPEFLRARQGQVGHQEHQRLQTVSRGLHKLDPSAFCKENHRRVYPDLGDSSDLSISPARLRMRSASILENMGGLVVWLLPHSQFVLPNDIEERKHLRQRLRVLPNKKRVVPARDFDVDVLHA